MIIKDEKFLKLSCSPISSVQEGMEICDILLAELEKAGGIGLAANQIGIRKKAFVLAIPDDDPEHPTVRIRKFINPEIICRQDPIVFNNEGCLSFPGKWISTLRFNKIKIRDLLNPDGLELTGLWSVAAEHEFSHLNSETMFSRKIRDIRPKAPCPCKSGLIYSSCCEPLLKQKGML